jgi:hypothetical protein
MKIYFDDPEYDGQFLRMLDHASLGAQIGEAWAIAAQIRAGTRRNRKRRDRETRLDSLVGTAKRRVVLGRKRYRVELRISEERSPDI